jgi:hypothetical protein
MTLDYNFMNCLKVQDSSILIQFPLLHKRQTKVSGILDAVAYYISARKSSCLDLILRFFVPYLLHRTEGTNCFPSTKCCPIWDLIRLE